MKSVCLVGALSAAALSVAVPLASAQAPAYQPCGDSDSVKAAGYDPASREDLGNPNAVGCYFLNEQGNRMTVMLDNNSWENEIKAPNSNINVTPIDPLSGHAAVKFDGPGLPNSCIVVVQTADKPFEVRIDSYGDICRQAIAAAAAFAPSLAS